MKTCTVCKQSKDESEFNKNKVRKDGRSNICRPCSNSHCRDYYSSNKKGHTAKVASLKKVRRDLARAAVLSILQKRSCATCKEKDVRVLGFHHIDPRTKTMEIANLVSLGYSLDVIKTEIKKCRVLCANCHVRLHAPTWKVN